MEADCISCSLGNLSQLMTVTLYQEVFEAGNVLVKRTDDPKEKEH